jgi:hypothetical protein
MIGETVHPCTNGTLWYKQSLTDMQQNVSPRGNTTTPLESNQTAQSERIMNTGYNLRRHMITTANPQNNALVERWFRNKGEISRCQLSQINMEEEFWEGGRKKTWCVV